MLKAAGWKTFRLQIMNATETGEYRIDATGLDGLTIASDATVTAGAS